MIHHCLKHESTFPAHLTQTEITFPDIKTREYHINMCCSSQGVVMGFHADSGSHDKHCQIFACITFYHSTHEPQTLIFTPLFLFLLTFHYLTPLLHLQLQLTEQIQFWKL